MTAIPEDVVSTVAWRMAVRDDADLTGYRSNGYTRRHYERAAREMLTAALQGYKLTPTRKEAS